MINVSSNLINDCTLHQVCYMTFSGHLCVFNSDYCTRSVFVPLHVPIRNVLSRFYDCVHGSVKKCF